MIQPIVKGYGDLEAVPVLLRRLRNEAGEFGIVLGTPIRRSRTQLVNRESLCQTIELGRRQPGCSSILILFDGDDDCPAELAPNLQRWAAETCQTVPCAIVMAHREYEAWFLAAAESLRGYRGIRADASPPLDPESPRGAKEALEDLMVPGSAYHEKADQPALPARFDMAAAYRRSRSFRRMTAAFGTLLRAEGANVGAWPPAAWGT